GEAVATGTVGAFLAEWLEVRSTSLRPASVRAYRTHLGYLIDQLGTVKLADLGPGHVAACQTALLARLSPTTVRGVMVTLRQALKTAVAWRRLPWNPAAEVTMPQVLPSPMHPWTTEELRAFLAAAEGDRFYPIFVLLVSTGMRRGEVLGLRWADVDLDAGRLAVRHTIGRVGGKVLAGEPKTAKSKRSIALDPATVAVVRRHRIAQLEERLAWVGLYRDQDLVFAGEDGAPINPEYVGRALRRIAGKAGVRPVRTHDLRHGWATAALEAGVHPKVVSDRLGHSKVSVTLDVYSHVAQAVEEEAARLVASKLLGAPDAAPL
ncbi:MAG: tyrosine-type recombinase/integrase, partial [Acidimicrobiia bacterium]